MVSVQPSEPLNATLCREGVGYTRADETAPSMEEMDKLIEEKVIKRALATGV